MDKVYITNNESQTQNIAKELASSLRGGELVALAGDLGVGKTTFTQALAKALGVSRNVNSPTFIIHRMYRIMNNESGIKSLHHIDLYRVNSPDDAVELGLGEILEQQESVIVIEWAEKMGNLLPKRRIDIKFEYIDENERKITIHNMK